MHSRPRYTETYFCMVWSVITLLILILALPSFQAQAADSARVPLRKNQRLANFQTYEGETFQVYGGSGVRQVEHLRLDQVIDKGSTPIVEQFWLRFLAPSNSTLTKGTYFFEHPEAGKFRLWLVPASANQPGRFFDARFNLMLNQP